MKIGIPKEIAPGETRVAIIPSLVPHLTRAGHSVIIEQGAGAGAFFPDAMYEQAGATIARNATTLYRQADIILKVQTPQRPRTRGKHEAEMMHDGAVYIGFLSPSSHPDTLRLFAKRHITGFSLEYLPRITRAQSMDALSSMATVAGYKAVLTAAEHTGKMFPLLMTAAGTVPPAHVLVLGAGVAGLQAIATAKRLGARVEAFDPRPAVRDQVKSLGATFIDMEISEQAETAGGYAKELSKDFLKREQEVIGARLAKTDVVITTAQVFGKRAPVLITREMVQRLKPGSVIVDLAAQQGGNCALTVPNKVVHAHGVTILGPVNLPAAVPVHASQMYAQNLLNLLLHIFPKADSTPDFNDQITRESCLLRKGEIVNETVKSVLGKGKRK